MTTRKSLSAVACKALRPRAKDYEVPDGAVTGAYVLVRPTGALSYVLRYRFQGKGRKLVIGCFTPDAGGLAAMRKLAHEAQAKLASARHGQGQEPAAAKRAQRASAARQRAESDAPHVTPPDAIERVVDRFLAEYAAGQRDHKETARILRKDIVGRWQGRALSSLTSADVRAMQADIRKRAPVGVNRIFGKLRVLCNWAVEHELIESSPCDKVRKVKVETPARDRVLTDAEIALVWRAAGDIGLRFGAMYRWQLLTGCRRSEAAGMTWGEFDFAGGLWNLPAARSKNKRPHSVPLTAEMQSLLASLPRYGRAKDAPDYVFTPEATPPSGFSKGRARLDKAMLAILRANDPDASLPAFVLHDVRRTLATGMQRLGVPLHVIEKCINHASGSYGGIVSVYQRYAFEPEMRDAFARWTAHVARIVA